MVLALLDRNRLRISQKQIDNEIHNANENQLIYIIRYESRNNSATYWVNPWHILFQLLRWSQEYVHQMFILHPNPGSTIQSVADFEDLHRRIDREMTSQEPELSNLRGLIHALPVSPERQHFQVI